VLVRCLAIPGGFPPDIPSKGILSEWMVGEFFESSIVSVVFGILLVYFQALQLNRVVIQNRMTHELTLFPGMMYVLIVSYFPAYDGLSSPLLANTFVLIALESLFSTHKKTGAAGRIFDSGFWLSLAGLFYFGYTVLLLFGIVGLSALRTLKSREWLQYFIGYITPIGIVAMLNFILHEDLIDLTQHVAGNLGAFELEFTGMRTFIHIGFFGVLLLGSVLSFGSFKQRKNIHTQKKVDLILWLLLFGFTVALIQTGIDASDWIVLVIPLATFMAMIIAQSRQYILFEVVHFLFLSGAIALQLWDLVEG
jgi:hypothetical protein